MDGLHKNINTYLHSGSKPCKAAGAGEYPIGISFSYPGVVLKNQGAPLEIILPKEGLGWEMEATAVMRAASMPMVRRRSPTSPPPPTPTRCTTASTRCWPART